MSSLPVCYQQKSAGSIALACVLIFGTFFSYVPQWITIIRARSSEGLSYVSLAMGLTSGLLTLSNAGILKWQSILCCANRLSVAQCLENNLLIQQLSVGPTCLFIIFILFLVYFNHKPLPGETRKQKLNEYFWALVSLAASLVLAIFSCVTAYVLYYGAYITGEEASVYARVLGIVSAVLTFFMWAPQIWTTWKASEGGVLSLPMLLIQAPGAGMTVVFQLLDGADWTTWAPYGVAGIEQCVLIVMLVYFYIRDWNKEPKIDELVALADEEHRLATQDFDDSDSDSTGLNKVWG